MYIRNFTEMFKEYWALSETLKTMPRNSNTVQLEIRKNALIEKLNKVGKTSVMYGVKAIINGVPITEYLVDIKPEDIELILRYRYKTREVTEIHYEQLI